MKISRRQLIKAAGAVVLGAAMPGARATTAAYSWKFGHGFPPSHPIHKRAVEAAAWIKQQSKGQVDIGVFPNSQLGGDNDLLSQVYSGGIEMFTTGGIIMSTLVPHAAISGLGFIFKDYPSVWSAMDGKLGDFVRAAFAKKGLHAVDRIWDNGFREITTSNRPIAEPKDLANLKIRVPVSPLYISLFKALGASPTSINLAEVYTALQTGVVEGQENPLVVTDTAKFYEVQKFCSLTNHIWDGSWIVINGDAWDGMPADLQAIVSHGFNDLAPRQRADIAQLNDSLGASLAQRGLKVNHADPAPFRDALLKAGFYTDWQAKFGAQAWTVLESAVGKLS
ncbi:MAG TPA: TRAP transporter substrate-binding protein [Bordetella sp.]|jgi:tripartite ATP-independent transporter DctP family solute receptor|nr:TRAP transporter substrate-binding protein [Bordetella sp.]